MYGFLCYRGAISLVYSLILIIKSLYLRRDRIQEQLQNVYYFAIFRLPKIRTADGDHQKRKITSQK